MRDKRIWSIPVVLAFVFLIYVAYTVHLQWNPNTHLPNSIKSLDFRSPSVEGHTEYTHLKTNLNIVELSNKSSYDHVMQEAVQHRNKVLEKMEQKHSDKCMTTCNDHMDLHRQSEYQYFTKEFNLNHSLFAALEELEDIKIQCDGKIEIYYKSFGILRDVILHVNKWQTTNLSEAGRVLYKFKSHFLRTDDTEIIKPEYGLLEMNCPGQTTVVMDNKTLENVEMLKCLKTYSIVIDDDNSSVGDTDNPYFALEKRFTVAIERGDYANFYHIMLHMHSIFTMLMMFHRQPVNMTVLIFDAHPQAEVDQTLETLYGPLIRVTTLPRNVKFQNLVLSFKEGQSLLSKHWMQSLPYLEEFRSFVLNQHLLQDSHFRNCQKLTITFIWRRDKIWHPRNLYGSVQRKIFNEAEIFQAVYDKYPEFCVNGLLAESLPMKEQLKYIRKTDILIGMHGAGLTHTLFLPKTSGLLELFPENFRKDFHHYKLFEAIARWRNLPYVYWENTISEHTMHNYFTRVDPDSFLQAVEKMVNKLCMSNQGRNY